MLLAKGLSAVLIQVLILGAALLLPAGTWEWPRAIQFLSLYAILALGAVVFLAIKAPASLEARLIAPMAKSQPILDKVISISLSSVLMLWFVFIPADVFHIKLLPLPVFWVSVWGGLASLLGFGVILLSLYQNEFAAPIVKDQSERGHELRDTGLYGVIRHPMYLGFMLFLPGLALWLDSYAGFFAMFLVWWLFRIRIFIEEKTLRETLSGYKEYMSRVKHRVIPGVW